MKLKLNDVTKSYGSNLALSGFSAIFTPGIWALLGPNGSGKSTLMNIITDNLKADRGEITYVPDSGEEENVLKWASGSAKSWVYAAVSRTLSEFYRRAVHVVHGGAERYKKTRRRSRYEILAAVELDDVPRRRIGAFRRHEAAAGAGSGGARQSEILILDEPTAGLDPKQRIAIRNYISKISFNKIVIIATHVVSDIEFIAHGVIMLKKGVIADNASPQELIKKISGQVWNIACDEGEVQAMQQNTGLPTSPRRCDRQSDTAGSLRRTSGNCRRGSGCSRS